MAGTRVAQWMGALRCPPWQRQTVRVVRGDVLVQVNQRCPPVQAGILDKNWITRIEEWLNGVLGKACCKKSRLG